MKSLEIITAFWNSVLRCTFFFLNNLRMDDLSMDPNNDGKIQPRFQGPLSSSLKGGRERALGTRFNKINTATRGEKTKVQDIITQSIKAVLLSRLCCRFCSHQYKQRSMCSGLITDILINNVTIFKLKTLFFPQV